MKELGMTLLATLIIGLFFSFKIYPDLEQKFLNILRNSGLPDLKFGKKIDFEELYKARLN